MYSQHVLASPAIASGQVLGGAPIVLPIVSFESILNADISKLAANAFWVGSDQDGEAGLRLHFGPSMRVAGTFRVDFRWEFLSGNSDSGIETDLCDVNEEIYMANGAYSYTVVRPVGNIHDFVDFNPVGSGWCEGNVTDIVVTRIA